MATGDWNNPEMTVELIKDPDDLIQLMPLIQKMALIGDYPFPKLVDEVAQSYFNPTHLTFLLKDGGTIMFYLSGYFLNEEEFYISQMMRADFTGAEALERMRPESIKMLKFIEDTVRGLKGKRLVALSLQEPLDLFTKFFGFELKRYYIVKEL